MSTIMITEFNPANNRKTVASGEEFEVDLAVMALPISDAASDEVEFSSSLGGFTVSPSSFAVRVEAQENRVTKHFRMSIRGKSTDITEITARAKGSGSADSFVIRVLV